MKKVLCLIIGLMFSIMTLCACNSTYENSWLKHNYPRDYAQTIMTIQPVTENVRKDSGQDVTFTTEAIDIYKSQLVSYINTYGSTYVNNYGMSYNDMVDYMLEQLILTNLVLVSADIMFETREIFWTKEDIDTIQHSVYDSIDEYYNDIYNDVLDRMGLDPVIVPDAAEQQAETTYPVKPEEAEDDNRFLIPENERIYGNNAKHDDWYLDPESYLKDGIDIKWYIENDDEYWYSLPGNFGNEQMRAAANAAMKELVTTLSDNVKNVIGITEEELADIDKEISDLRTMIKEDGAAYAYRSLGKTLLCKKLFGDSLISSQKMTILQECIEGRVTVSDEEIIDKYNKLLGDQIMKYSDSSQYDSAVSGDDMILYHPNDNYVFVKHILIPFSDAQKEYLTAYKEIATEEEYIRERNNEVNNIVAYAHVDGEDDKTHPLTVDEIWSEVRMIMSRASANAYDAERAFDDLIYKYSTDPGSFGYEKSYAVKYQLAEGDSETYMEEFANTARAFRDDGYKVGEIFNEYVVTDYGVHIMYYAADHRSGEKLTLNSYKTPGRYTAVKDVIRDELLETKAQNEFDVWQNERIQYYRNVKKIITKYDKTFADLYQ